MNGIGHFLKAFGLGAVCSVAVSPGAGAAGLPPIPLADLRNLEYQGVDRQAVKLSEGRYDGPLPGAKAPISVRFAEDLVVSGDLDGDGFADAAVPLTKTAGSGQSVYLAVVAQQAGGLKNTATFALGERVQIRSLKLGLGTLILELVAAGPGDPACCPGTKTLKTFRLLGTELREAGSQSLGKLSVQDLEGVNWKLLKLGFDAPAVVGESATVVFQNGRISGNGGCNRYFARIQPGSAPGELSVGPVGSTRMACPGALMKLEGDFLRKLETVQKFGFFMGKLALSYPEKGKTDALQFVAEPLTEAAGTSPAGGGSRPRY